MTAISFTPLQEVDIVFLGYYPETKSLQIMYLKFKILYKNKKYKIDIYKDNSYNVEEIYD